MQNQYYLKDKKAQIYKKISTQDDTGQSIEKYYPIAPAQIWCYARQLSQTDVFQAAAYGDNETRLFVFNYYPKVDVYCMVLYRGEWYRVTRVDTTDDYKGEMYIYVQNAVGGWIPRDDKIEDYTPGMWDE